MKRSILTLLLGLATLLPSKVLACAACYGQSDSPLAAGLNWGIMSLLGMIGLVLAGCASFFIYLARKASTRSVSQPAAQRPAPALATLHEFPAPEKA